MLSNVEFYFLADYIKVCNRKDPDINNCIVDSINKLKPQLFKGIPELNVPPLEPFRLDTLQFSIGDGQKPVNLTNMEAWGVIKFNIIELK